MCLALEIAQDEFTRVQFLSSCFMPIFRIIS